MTQEKSIYEMLEKRTLKTYAVRIHAIYGCIKVKTKIKRLVIEFSSGQRKLDSFLSALANMVVDIS